MSVTNIETLKDLISTAKAAYVNFPGALNSQSMKDAGFTDSEIASFFNSYAFVHQQKNTSTGFSATLFKDNKTDAYIFAIRGTDYEQGLLDLGSADVQDIGVKGFAYHQAVDLYRYWKKLISPTNQSNIYSDEEIYRLYSLMNDGSSLAIESVVKLTEPYQQFKALLDAEVGVGYLNNPNIKVTVTGHSLGGNLAYAFTRMTNRIENVVTLNGPGLRGEEWLYDLGFRGAATVTTSINAEGDAVHSLGFGSQLGKIIEISQEVGLTPIIDGLDNNHSTTNGLDSLNLMDLFSKLDPSQANNPSGILANIMRASSNKTIDTFENMLDGLRYMLLGETEKATIESTIKTEDLDKRGDLYLNMDNLEKSVQFKDIVGKIKFVQPSSNGLDAKNDYGQFLALYFNTPFALTGSEMDLSKLNPTLYSLWQDDKELSDADKLSGKQHFSDMWYIDRAEFVERSIVRNTDDNSGIDFKNPHGHMVNFTDIGSGTNFISEPALAISGPFASQISRVNVGFGDKQENELSGDNGEDHLYGDTGNDTLKGEAGHDYLEGGAGNDLLYGGDGTDQLYGGADDDQIVGEGGNDLLFGAEGNDTYSFTGQFGRDMIKDSDNQGSIEFNSTKLSQLTQSAKDSIIYYDDINNPTKKAVLIDEGNTKSLIISTVTKNGNAIIDSGNSVTIKDWNGSNLGITLTPTGAQPATPNVITLTGNGGDNVLSLDKKIEEDANFVVTGNESLNITGGEGRDLIQGLRSGSDTLDGGNGNDLIIGGNSGAGEYGKDIINGDGGNDYVFVSPLNSVVHGGTGDDVLSALNGAYFKIYPVSERLSPNGTASSHAALTPDQVWQDVLSVFNYDLYSFGFKNLTANLNEYNSVAPNVKFVIQPLSFESSSIEFAPPSTDTYNTQWKNFSYDYSFNQLGRSDVTLATNPLYYSTYALTLFGAHTVNEEGVSIFGDDGSDVIHGGVYSDNLSGGKDKDFMWGLSGNDLMDGGTEDDNINGNEGSDTLIGGAGSDHLWGDGDLPSNAVGGNDVLYGGDGKDALDGGQGDDYLDGGIGIDELNGGNGNNYLYGGDDTDKDNLVAGTGNDTLVMGASDIGNAGGGNNIYIWDTHQVTKNNVRPSSPPILPILNHIPLANDASIRMANAGNSEAPSQTQENVIWIYNTEGSNTLGVIGQSNFSGVRTFIRNNVLQLTTSNGQQIQVADLQSNNAFKIVFGTSVEQLAQAPLTNFALTDDHFLNGIAPLDQLDVTSADISLALESVPLVFASPKANIYLAGSLVNDELTANLAGSTIIGGKGNDKLIGDIGGDTYLIRKGDGHDVITEKGGSNRIKLDKNIHVGELHTYRSGADLILKISPEQSITVKSMFDVTTGALIAENSIQDILLYDDTLWDINAIKANAAVSTIANDNLSGFETNDTLRGDKGDDVIQGGAGNDVYQYAAGDGDDIIIDLNGIDSVELSGITRAQVISRRDANNNLILSFENGGKITILDAFDAAGNFTSNSVENIKFIAENIAWTSVDIKAEVAKNAARTVTGTGAAETLKGDAGKDILVGGVGGDQLVGNAHDDIYQYSLGDGNDTIVDTEGFDTVQFGAGVTELNIQLKVDSQGEDLLINMNNGEVITVQDMFTTKGGASTPQILSIIDSLKSGWISQAEKLIEDNFGLVGSGDLKLDFVRLGAGGTLAYVDIGMALGESKANELILNIDLDDFADLPNGNGYLYYDRVIVHEIAHAIVASNMDSSALPSWFTEGTSEIIHGSDERALNNLGYFPDKVAFNNLFKTTRGEQPQEGYTVSYVAVKLLDQDIRNHGGAGIRDVFDQLKSGHSLDESLSIISLERGMSSVWTNLVSFENRVREIGFTNFHSILNLSDSDTGSIAGSDYGNSALDASDILPDVNTGAPIHFNLVVPPKYQALEDNRIDLIKFNDGKVWDLERIKLEIEKGKLIGSTGDDVLIGTSGNDILRGNQGKDQLSGNAGDDVYLYKLGDGDDIVNDLAGKDTIQFDDVLESQVSVKRVDSQLVLSISGGGTVTVNDAFNAAGEFTLSIIETINFADGKFWNLDLLKQKITGLVGTLGNDLLLGGIGNDTLTGGKGNDQLKGGAGDDTYQYFLGDGNDVIADTSGIDNLLIHAEQKSVTAKRDTSNNLVLFLSDGSTLTVKSQFDSVGNLSNGAIETISFSVKSGGNVIIDGWNAEQIKQEVKKYPIIATAPEIFIGTEGSDILTSGKGNDQLNGGAGDDAYIYDIGSGKDVISDSGGVDRLIFNFKPDQLAVVRDGLNNLLIICPDGGSISVQNAFDGSGSFTGSSIEEIQFSDGSVWDSNKLKLEVSKILGNIKGTTGNDTLVGSVANEFIFGDAGQDSISGGAGNDVLYDSVGNGLDILLGNEGDDLIFAANGGKLYGGIGNDHLDGGVGTSYLYGEAGNDTLFSGASGASLWGGDGDDTFIINNQAGIANGINPYGIGKINDSSDSDIIILTNNLLPENLVVKAFCFANGYWEDSRSELVFYVAGSNYRSTPLFSIKEAGSTGSSYEYFTIPKIKTIEFANGVHWNSQDIYNASLKPTALDDTIVGASGNDYISGGRGNDALYGNLGDDIYSYSRGDGSDTIYDRSGFDTINFMDVNSNEIAVARDGFNSLIVTVDSGITIKINDAYNPLDINWNPISEFKTVEKFLFSDGVSWDVDRIQKEAVKSTSNNDLIYGFAADDFIDGGLGNDRIFTMGGNDTIIGGKGNDVINRDYAEANVTYRFSVGDGSDTVSGGLGLDVIDFGSIKYSEILTSANNNVIRVVVGPEDNINIANLNSLNIGTAIIDELRFADKTISVQDLLIDLGYRTGLSAPTAIFNSAGNIVSGIAEFGSTVVLKNLNNDYLGISQADSITGAYSITLSKALINKETVNVHVEFSGLSSPVLSVIAPDKTPPTLSSAAFDTTYAIVNGVAEAGSTVTVKKGAQVIGVATATVTGAYSVTLASALINKEIINVTATDDAGNISTAKTLTAPDKNPPTSPTATFDTAGKVITGVAEAGSTVVVKNSGNTTTLGTVVANATTGAYTITLATALINKETVNITAKDAAGNVSAVKAIVAPDKTAPSLPTAAFDTAGKVITGVAEAGSTVTVKNSGNTTTLGTVTANATTGAYTITLTTALINKETVNITAKDAAGNVSAVKAIIAPDKTAPALPTAAFDTAGKVITGVAEAGSTVEVKNSGNTATLGTATANATTGAYTITLTTALINKETVNVTAKDAAGNVSTVKAIIAPDKTAPALPTAAFDTAGKVITGVAEAGSTVVVKNSGNTTTLGTVTANATTGAYTITLTTALINKETVNVTAKDAAGNVSAVKAIIAPDKTAPALPTAVFDTAGKVITGVAEAGSTVVVKNSGNTTTLGTVTANAATGAYTITLTTALINKETVNVTAKDVAGNVSAVKAIIAPDKTAPALPTAVFDTAGKVITGVAEAGSTVVVKNSGNTTTLGTATANATTGAYTITLTTALINKETVNVTAKDVAGNVSAVKAIIAPDKTAPALPTGAFDSVGKVITGIAEAGSTVMVKNSGNTTTLGTVTANATTGAYSVTLTTALTNGQTVNVTAKDAAGNVSAVKAIIAPKLAAALASQSFTSQKSVDPTHQLDSMIQAMAAFAPPSASESKVLVGVYDMTQPILASQA